MSYIGVPPVTGDFVILDTISTSATASYTLQRNSSNFSPESANHMLVSLNGSIQKPNSSFTVSGSTITFSSALTSSDVIDFILVLGNVNAVGVATTVSDNAITDAKTNFVSTSSTAGLQIKGDGTTDGTLALNCRVNSHAIKLKSPPHSASQSYTLTFPSTSPSAGKVLQTDGSGNLSFADAGGITVAQQFNLTSDQNNTSNFFYTSNLSVEGGSIGTAITESTGVFSFPSTGVYHVSAFTTVRSSSTSTNATLFIYFATDGATFNKVASSGQRFTEANKDFNMHCSDFVDVTDTSNCQVKFGVDYGGGTMLTRAGTDGYTKFSFIRLGDT